jgi:hypothetical protein
LKKKQVTYVLILLLIMLSGTFIIIKVNQYKRSITFTKEKWFEVPNKRFLIVKDMINKHDFANMTKEQVINLLGEPGDGWGSGGVPVRTYDSSKPVDLLYNKNSVCYFTKTGQFAEEFRGFYLMFDNNGKVIDYAIIHFTT